MEENCGGREAEDGFCHLDGGCHCCGKQSRMEETNQWPYSPRGELGTKSSKSVSDPDATPPLGQATEVSQPALLLENLGGNRRRLID